VFSSGYYQAIQRSNVKLVSERINRFARDGAVTTDGRFHKLDVLILATGFQGDAFMRPMSVVGENGIRIDEVWSAKPIAYRATSIPHMPNFFMLIGPYSPIASASVIEIAEWQVGFIMSCIDLVRTRKIALSASSAATKEYIAALDLAAPRSVWASGCDSWYLGPDRLPGLYTRSPSQHKAELAQQPDLRDFDVRPLTQR
jgi:cation diffusion facilitator CzcD-associated flavoprotein CzcO